MATALQLTLYGRPGCHLCERMLTELEAMRGELDFSVSEVDVDGDRRLFDAYGEQVPVLAAGDVEVCRHFLDPAAVRALFSEFS